MRIFPISISAGFPLLDNIRQRALMILYFREQSPLNLLRESGNPGHHPNADFSCGLLLITDVGQRTDWQGEVSPTRRCLLYDQHEENIHHLLIGGVVSREFWFSLLSHFGVAALAPQPSDQSFDDWWRKVDEAASGDVRKGLNSLVILGAWSIWRRRDDCIFNGSVSNVNVALRLARDEAYCWSLAGAKGFSLLTAGGSV
jgi:hypothetical protein